MALWRGRRSRVRLRDCEEALDLLETAIDLGWFSPEFWVRHDKSFEYLHGDERFERLMERAREKAAAFVE